MLRAPLLLGVWFGLSLLGCGDDGTAAETGPVPRADALPADVADVGVEPLDTPAPVEVEGEVQEVEDGPEPTPTPLRVGQYNVTFLNSYKLTPNPDAQVQAAVKVMAGAALDVVVINEFQVEVAGDQSAGTARFDDPNAQALADLLNEQGGAFAHTLGIVGNNGVPWPGYVEGEHDPTFAHRSSQPGTVGRIGYAFLSRYPVVQEDVRVIVDFAWSDLPGNLLGQLADEQGVVVPAGYPLFATALAIVPVKVGEQVVHHICLHATPPVGKPTKPYRNRDQLHALRLLIDGELPGVAPLPKGAHFVLQGDFNADPDHGDAFPDAIQAVLSHPLVVAHEPEGAGTGGVNPERNTFASACPASGGPDPTGSLQFQLDYVLPSTSLGPPVSGGLFFPSPTAEPEQWELACEASDHMLLWAELAIPPDRR